MIPADIMRELRYLEISTARAIRTARVGPYTSRTRGPGFDFDQHVPYRPGDDVRRIDWNVTARLNVPYVRQTHAERELDVIVAVDASPSMSLGAAHAKKKLLMSITASLLFSAGGDQINTGFLGFADRVLTWSPARRTSGRTWHILEELWGIDAPVTSTRLLPAVRHLVSSLRTMSVIVIVSDFLTGDDPFSSSELRTLAATHDVIAVVIEDPADTALPPGRGFIRVRDVETGGETTVALTDRNRRAFAARMSNRRQGIVDACYRLGMQAAFIRTDGPPIQPLVDLFARRKGA